MANSTGYRPFAHVRFKRYRFRGETDTERNQDVYTKLIQFLDDKSLLLIMKEVSDHGREAVRTLRDHYADQEKLRIIFLFTELK